MFQPIFTSSGPEETPGASSSAMEVALLGVDSVQVPIERRREVWQRPATDLRPPQLDELATDEVTLDGLPAAWERILSGGARGRTLVGIG